ncbi:Sec-independent protein translocase subunit TatA/TatB [Deinococcus sp.]|uniref:Sec-independent protein translocase subunit TatA/TatB n=1 Tax=Deinococcus sp. TaxID=47478 RepID=UPI003C7AC242
MPNLGFPEIMIILVVALLVFGPKKLPDLGRSLGNGIREFRKGTQGLKAELEGSLKPDEVPAPLVAEPVRLTKQADAKV